MKSEIEDIIRQFIDEQRRVDMGGSLRKIFDAFNEHESKDEQRHTEVMSQYKSLSYRVGSLESDRDKIEDKLEATGRHEVVQLQKKSDLLQGILLKCLGAVLLVALSSAITWLAGRH